MADHLDISALRGDGSFFGGCILRRDWSTKDINVGESYLDIGFVPYILVPVV